MKNADLIDKFLSGTLSPEESAILAQKIVDDPPFAQELQEYQQSYEALKNRWLKQQITQASQIAAAGNGASLISHLKLWGGLGAVAVATAVTVFIFNKKTTTKNNTDEIKTTQITTEKQLPADQPQSSVTQNDTVLNYTDALKVNQNPAFVQSSGSTCETPSTTTNRYKSEGTGFKAKESFTQNKTQTPDPQIPNVSNAEDYRARLSAMAPQPQWFSLDNRKDTVITCKKGTRIYFPSNCFEIKSRAANDRLTIKVTEYYTYQDFFAAGLTTTSHGKILNSGGMLNIEVKNGNETVKLKKDSSYALWMPNRNNKRDEEMQTFYGKTSDTGINWDLNPEYPETGLSSARKPASKLSGAPFAIYEPVKYRSIGLDVKGFTTAYKPVLECIVASKGAKWGRYIPLVYANDKAKENFKKLYDTFHFFTDSKLKQLIADKANATIAIFLDSNGIVTEFQCQMDKKNYRKYNKEYRDFVRSVTPVDLSPYFDKKMMPESFEIFLRPIYKDSLPPIDSYIAKDSATNTAEKNLANFNRLLSYNTGWINCDKFSKQPQYAAWFKNAPENTQITVYFEQVNSCLNVRSETIDLPLNVPATVIAVNNSGSETTMHILKLARRQDVIELPPPVPFDLKKIAVELKKCQEGSVPLP